MDRGAWWAAVQGVAEGRTRLSTARLQLLDSADLSPSPSKPHVSSLLRSPPTPQHRGLAEGILPEAAPEPEGGKWVRIPHPGWHFS